jgi:uncharacterized protein YjiS (DUF1127 family)
MAANVTLENSVLSRSKSTTLLRLISTLNASRALWARWMRDSSTRRRLGEIDDRILRDMGFDPDLAREEALRPFWKPLALKQRWDR